jgi:hypothetical protein
MLALHIPRSAFIPTSISILPQRCFREQNSNSFALLSPPVTEEIHHHLYNRQCQSHAGQKRRKRRKTPLQPRLRGHAQKKGSYLQAQYLRPRSRRGPKKAIVAVAASILTAAYHMLKNGILYQDLGANHFDQRAKGKHVLRLVNRLQNLGFAVHITPMAAQSKVCFFLV